jgi:hypothetical protein
MIPTVATLHQAMAETGGLVRGELATTVGALDALGLAPGARIAAIASAVAAWAATRHAADPASFFKRVREMTRPAAGFGRYSGGSADNAEEGVRVIGMGLGRIAVILAEAGIEAETSAIVERVLLSRLLAAHRPHAIREALDAAEAAIARPDYRAGELVMGIPVPSMALAG